MHITPVNSKVIKIILKKNLDYLKNISGLNSVCSMTDIALTDHYDRSIFPESVRESFVAHFSVVTNVLVAKIWHNVSGAFFL